MTAFLTSEENRAICERLEAEFACACQRTSLAFKTSVRGVRLYYRQCVRCFKGKRIGKDEVRPGEEPGAYVEGKEREWWERRSRRHAELTQQAEKEKRAEWDRWYASYLQSPAWKHKRQMVLERDGGICRGCLVNRATQVHHLTYDRVGKELLFDLVAICDICHAVAHEKVA